MSLLDRLEGRAADVRWQVAGVRPALLAVRVARRFSAVRVTGLAAEMTYYLVLSLVPLTTALGASLGLLGRVLEPAQIDAMEAALVSGVQAVLSPQLAADVFVPLVHELLSQEQVGVAVGSIAGALWLGSRCFRAALRALADAYEVAERRGLVRLYALSLVFTLAAVLVVTALLSLFVVGPLLGGVQRVADAAGAGEEFSAAWSWGRWPVAGAVGVAFLAWLYHSGPRTGTTWRQALPGAVLCTAGLIAVTVGFRVYVDLAGPQDVVVDGGSEAVRVVARFIGTALAAMLVAWLGCTVVLLGGVVNAEWAAEREALRALYRAGGAGGAPGGSRRA